MHALGGFERHEPASAVSISRGDRNGRDLEKTSITDFSGKLLQGEQKILAK